MITLTAYAKMRGCSTVAVSKAISNGRLTASVVRDERGIVRIGDPELADREWAANTRARGAPPAPAASAAMLVDRPPVATPRADSAAEPAPPSIERTGSGPKVSGVHAGFNESRAAHARHRARREAALAEMAELDLAERRGGLVPADEARGEMIAAFSLVKTRLLGVATGVAQRLPHVALEVAPVVDSLIREALEELASGRTT